MIIHVTTMEVKPNQNIGIIVAQQCSAPAVQSSLSAFHQVGTAGAQRESLGKGYSSYLRLDTSIAQSVTYVYPVESCNINTLLLELQNVHLKDLVESYSIMSSKYLPEFRMHFETDLDTTNIGQCLSLKLKKSMMYHHSIDPFEVKYIIESNVRDVVVVPSPLAECTIDIICVTGGAMRLSNMYQGLFQDVKDSQTTLRNFQIKGIENIWPLRIVNDEYIECRGCNIIDMVRHPMINVRRMFTNNINETFKYYGNITTRQIIKKHLKILFKDDIDDKAADILIGNMMYKGYPIPVSQDGTTKQHRSLLFKMTYERFMEHINTIPIDGNSPIQSIYDEIAVGRIKH